MAYDGRVGVSSVVWLVEDFGFGVHVYMHVVDASEDYSGHRGGMRKRYAKVKVLRVVCHNTWS